VGFVDGANRHLKAFDVFLCTSIKEGLPYTLLEAGLAGLPTISTNVGGIPDVIEDHKNGILIPSRKVGDIVRAVEYMSERIGERKQFGENLKAKVKKEFSLEQMFHKTLTLYSH
jgi:glycosyltransferase involved in cell wall biosynthesis